MADDASRKRPLDEGSEEGPEPKRAAAEAVTEAPDAAPADAPPAEEGAQAEAAAAFSSSFTVPPGGPDGVAQFEGQPPVPETPAPLPPPEVQPPVVCPFDGAEALAEEVQRELVRMRDNGIIADGDLERGALESLKDFPVQMALEIIRKYSEQDMNTVRNKTGFFIGILKRFRSKVSQEGGMGMYGQPAAAMPPASLAQLGDYGLVAAEHRDGFKSLPFSVQCVFYPLYQSGHISAEDLEGKVFQSLAQFEEHTCMEMARKFCDSDLTRVNNKSGWLIGILKRFRQNGAPNGHQYLQQHQANNQAIAMGHMPMGGMGAMGAMGADPYAAYYAGFQQPAYGGYPGYGSGGGGYQDQWAQYYAMQQQGGGAAAPGSDKKAADGSGEGGGSGGENPYAAQWAAYYAAQGAAAQGGAPAPANGAEPGPPAGGESS